MPGTHLPAAGWYADPAGSTDQRYWDGVAWTGHTAPSVGGPPAATHPPQGWSHPARTSTYGLPASYGPAFARFDAGGSRVAWNWPAFLFGAVWYLYRGMWGKALVYVAAALFSGGFLLIPLYIYSGMMGTYDLYLLRNRNTQFW